MGLSYNTDNQPGNNYDRDGSPSTWQAQTLTFDDNDTLTAIGAQSQYGYSDGARVWKQTAAGKTYFLNVGGTPLCELDANGKVLASNTVGADGLCARTTASGSTFYSFDLQGGTALRLDAVGNVLGSYSHDAYGNRTSTDNSSDPYSGYGAKWGYYRDAETGLSLLGARYYDASQGRFLNRDPIGYDGGSNLYGYAGNNPISHIDPSGLKPCWADDDGSPRFDKCYQSDLQAGDHPGIKGAKDCVNFWAHLIPFYPLIPALTGQDMWGCSLTPQQRSDEADAATLAAEDALSELAKASGLNKAADAVPKPPLSPGKLVPKPLRDLAERAFENHGELANMSSEQREAAARGYEGIAEITKGPNKELTRLYNLERAKFLRGEVDRIASNATQFKAELQELGLWP